MLKNNKIILPIILLFILIISISFVSATDNENNLENMTNEIGNDDSIKVTESNEQITHDNYGNDESQINLENNKKDNLASTGDVSANDGETDSISTVTGTQKLSTSLPANYIYVSTTGDDTNGDGSSNNPYKTIKNAVSKANDNDTIYIFAGKYDENSILISKNLTIIGENKNTVITSTTSNKKVFEGQYDTNISLRFENLTFDNIKPGMYNAVLNLRNVYKNEIVNCVFENTNNQYAIWSSASETLIDRCKFRNIEYTSSGDIIYLTGKGIQNISNTIFNKITSSAGGVISIILAMNRPNIINIDNITISEVNGKFNGIDINNIGYGNISNTLVVKNSKFENNEFEKKDSAGGSLIVLTSSSKLTITNSTIKDNYAGRGIFAGRNNESEINANYNLIYNNTADIIFSTSSSSPVKKYNVEYNYWGSENPDLGDLKVNAYYKDSEFNEINYLKSRIAPNMSVYISVNDNDVIINVVLNQNATGTIVIEGISGIEPQTLVNGTANFTILNLKAKQYPITVKYSGDDQYNSAEFEDTITVKEKLNCTIKVQIDEVYEGSNAVVIVTLPQNATGTIVIEGINGTVPQTLVNGTVNFTILNLNAKMYPITVKYSGDEQYNPKEINDTITVKEKLNANIKVQINEVYEGNNTVIIITLPQNATGTIVIEGINGTEPQTLKNGTANFTISNLKAKQYPITIKYSGDDIFKSNSTNSTIIVKEPLKPVIHVITPKATKIIAKKKTFKAKTKVKKYKVTLKANGKSLANMQITLKIKGKVYKTKTNSKGVATFNIKKLNKKCNVNAVINFKGNNNYKSCMKKVKISVKK